jgi:predicted O-methyltransferase YrrM
MRYISPSLALLRHLGDRQFRRDWLLAGALADARGQARVVDLHDQFPEVEAASVDMGTIQFDRYNMDPLERFILGALCRIRRPRRIFEFGTFNGATTLILARNSPKADVMTLDLRSAGSALAARGIPLDEMVFHGTPEAARITQLYRDDPDFSFDEWRGSCDLIVIDAGHAFEEVRSDIADACRLASDGGIIVWDDYTPMWSGVVKAVDQSGLPVVLIAGTNLALTSPLSNPQ